MASRDLTVSFMLPLMRFRVADKSMEPTFKEGDYVLVNKLFAKLRKGDLVVVKHNNRYLLKRMIKISGNGCTLRGDNKKFSSSFAANRKEIIGKVIFHARR